MKRRRVDGAFTEIFMNIEYKSIQFTANKKTPVAPMYTHLYQPGYLLPIGRLHVVDSEVKETAGKSYKKIQKTQLP